MEALDTDAIRAALPCPPISGGAAADRITEALGTPNVIGEKANVTSFVVRRFTGARCRVEVRGSVQQHQEAMRYITASHPERTAKLPQ